MVMKGIARVIRGVRLAPPPHPAMLFFSLLVLSVYGVLYYSSPIDNRFSLGSFDVFIAAMALLTLVAIIHASYVEGGRVEPWKNR